jgi:hypothetical protein
MPRNADPKIGKCKACKEEGLPPNRPATYPGPRCYSHHQQRKREVRLAQHGRRVTTVYGITPEEYAEQYAYQGGLCAICRRARGNPDLVKGKKNLAVDHDHKCTAGHPHTQGCPLCFRSLLCAPCNDVLAHFRDDYETALRAAQYLASWPTNRRRAGLPWPPPVRTIV